MGKYGFGHSAYEDDEYQEEEIEISSETKFWRWIGENIKRHCPEFIKGLQGPVGPTGPMGIQGQSGKCNCHCPGKPNIQHI